MNSCDKSILFFVFAAQFYLDVLPDNNITYSAKIMFGHVLVFYSLLYLIPYTRHLLNEINKNKKYNS